MIFRKPWQTLSQYKAELERDKFDRKHGKPPPLNPWPTPFKDAPWLLNMHLVRRKPGQEILDRWDRAKDERGWKARLSRHPRARRAQLRWRYRNIHLYRSPFTSRRAVNRFIDMHNKYLENQRIQRSLDDTWSTIRHTPP